MPRLDIALRKRPPERTTFSWMFELSAAVVAALMG